MAGSAVAGRLVGVGGGGDGTTMVGGLVGAGAGVEDGAAVGIGVGASAMAVQANTPSKSSPTRNMLRRNNLNLFIIIV